MAVIVSDSRNASYNGYVSTANGFYRAEAYNLTAESSTQVNIIAGQDIPVTFLNAGNCMGAAICLSELRTTTVITKTITIELQENVAGTWTTRTSKTNNPNEFFPSVLNYSLNPTYIGIGFVCFKFATPYAVDTIASKWRFRVTQGATGSPNYNFRTSNGTTMSFFAWCDNQVTYSDTNDAIIVINPVIVNGTFSPKPYTGTGDTATGVSVVMCPSFDLNDPYQIKVIEGAAPYTVTIDGRWYVSSNSGVAIGSATSPITYTKRVTVDCKFVQSVGTNGSQIVGMGRVANVYAINNSIKVYGEKPTNVCTTLTADAASGQAKINVADVTNFNIGDRIYIGRANTSNRQTEHIKYFTIASITGLEITLTGNLGEKRWAGGNVINGDAKYGILIKRDTDPGTVGFAAFYQAQAPIEFHIEGVCFQNITNSVSQRVQISPSRNQKYIISDCLIRQGFHSTDNTGRQAFEGVACTEAGIDVTNVHAVSMGIISLVTWTVGGIYEGAGGVSTPTRVGDLYMNNCNEIGVSIGSGVGTTLSRFTRTNSRLENPAASCQTLGGYDIVIDDCSFWGGGGGGTFCCAVGTTAANIKSFARNKFDNGLYGGLSISNIIVGEGGTDNEYGQQKANTSDIKFLADLSYCEYAEKNAVGNLIIDDTFQSNINDAGYFRVSKYNQVTNDNRIYTKYGKIISTGVGLSDTTVHTAGGYAMRFESAAVGDVFWKQNVPIGNCQAKDLMIGVWVNLNSANYWSGVNVMPRLTVTYDATATVYAEAARVTGWQYIFVPITPATTAGVIEVKITINTNQTGSNSYVYFDDFSVLYPAGYTLNLGGIDLWYNGEPVSPTISTSVSALDVWAADPSLFANGTVGGMVKRTEIKADDAAILRGIV